MERLEQAFDAARTFRPMSEAERNATAINPVWLGEEPQRLQQLMPQ